MDIEKISNLIKTKRKEKGLTQEELAQKINVTEKAISRWETGRGTPDISSLIPLSEELGISVSEILKGKEDRKEEKNILEIVDYIDKSRKKKNKYVIPIITIVYGILLLLYLWYLRVDYNVDGHLKVSYLGDLVFNLFVMSVVFITNRFIANNYYDTIEDRERMNKISYIMIFVLYMIMTFNMTIFARYLNGYSYNLIPFKTILGYWAFPDLHNILVNILGNIVIVMPIQFLIIKIFDIKDFKKCILIDFLLILLIETLQLITHAGIFDIDDMILNLIGMSIMYAITTGKHQVLYKYKELILTSILSLVIIFVLFEGLSLYHFGDIPTIIVLIRLIIGFIVIEGIIYFGYKLIKKKRTSQD